MSHNERHPFRSSRAMRSHEARDDLQSHPPPCFDGFLVQARQPPPVDLKNSTEYTGPPAFMEPPVVSEPPRYDRFPAKGLFGDPPFYPLRGPLTPTSLDPFFNPLPTPSSVEPRWPKPYSRPLEQLKPIQLHSFQPADSIPSSVEPREPSTTTISETPKTQESQGPSPPPRRKSKSLPIRPVSSRPRQTVSVQFSDVAAHTAKCDQCDKRNKDGMTRCLACGWQCCRRCLADRGGDRTHRSFTSTHAPESEVRTPVADTSIAESSSANTSSTSEARQAAEALWNLGSGGTRSHSIYVDSNVNGDQSARDTESLTELEDSEDPDETLTLGSESEVNEDVVEEHDIVDYREVRRNPPRVARPTHMIE